MPVPSPTTPYPSDLEIRPSTAADRPGVLALLARTLGWGDDARHGALFTWKHLENPWGPSPAWVALDAGRVVAFRTFMRWRFRLGDRRVAAARAVDTATHPDYQGRGLFSRLTREALDSLRSESVEFVFNTPNNQSRPGYLKLGWTEVGRLNTYVRPRRPFRILHLRQSRVAAQLWSEPSEAGVSPTHVLSDDNALRGLLESQPDRGGLRTDCTMEYLRWRYGSGPMGYRAMVAPDGVSGGVALFRVRRRGPSREVAICDVLVPGGGQRESARLARATARAVGGDHAVLIAMTRPSGFWPIPAAGPILTRNELGTLVSGRPLELSLGDVELF